MNLKRIISGLSLLLSCWFIADILGYLGVPDKIGAVPTFAIIGICGLIMIHQGRCKKRSSS